MTTLTTVQTLIVLLCPWTGGPFDPMRPTDEMNRIADFGSEVHAGLVEEGVCMRNPRPLPPRATPITSLVHWAEPAIIRIMAWDDAERVTDALRRVLADPPVAVAQVLTGTEAQDYIEKEVR